MNKYTKKAVTIEAIEFIPENSIQLSEFITTPVTLGVDIDKDEYYMIIDTLEGKMKAVEGDWIIKGIKGEFYPCKPDIFDATYRPAVTNNVGLSFSAALEFVKEGNKVARKGWNGKDMFIFLVDGSSFEVNRAPLNKFYPEGTIINYHAHIDMKTADNLVVPWLASQTDILATDWEIFD